MILEKSLSGKKIGFLTSNFPEDTQTFVLKQIINTIEQQHDINVFTEQIKSFSDSTMSTDLETYKLKEKVITYKNKSYIKALFFCMLHAIKKKSAQPIYLVLKAMLGRSHALRLKHYSTLSPLQKKPPFDLIHAQFGVNGIKAIQAKLCGHINCPIITTFHGYDAHFNATSLQSQRRKYKWLFHYGDLFTVNSQYLKQQLITLGCPEEKIHLVIMGIDTNFFTVAEGMEITDNKKNHKENTLKLISVGRLIELKNQKAAITAVKKLRGNGVIATCTIIGDGAMRNELEQYAEQLNIYDFIHFRGTLNQQEILDELQSHDVFLMTSTQDADGRQETQGVVTGEAQSCGLPVVMFDYGGTKSTIENGKTGFICQNEEEFIEKIMQLNDPNLRKIFGENARLFIEKNYSIEKSNADMNRIYRSLLCA